MNRHQRLVATLLTIGLVAGCAPTGGDLGGVATPAVTAGASIPAPSGEPTPDATGPEGSAPIASGSPGGSVTVRAYFFLGSFTGNSGLAPVLRDHPQTVAVGAAAMNDLLAGPQGTEIESRPAMYTDIPAGTRFLGLTISAGVATVNLSKEFEAGGDSASFRGRTAQVVYTLTQFPTIHGVQFELDGVGPKTLFIGSLGRADYTDVLPAIFVDRPAWGGVLGNPARITGLANVFEATFRIAIVDASGTVLVDRQAMASCGTGCWGTFDTTIPYHVAASGWGTLRVYDLSAKDGSREHLTEHPVWLTPGG